MVTWNIFSKRQRKEQGNQSNIFAYRDIPEKLRTQIIHILIEALGGAEQYQIGQVRQCYKLIVDTLCKEYGLFFLPPTKDRQTTVYPQELLSFFMHTKKYEECLDVVEVCFTAINTIAREHSYIHNWNAAAICDGAIQELNERFKESGVGYQFVDNQIIRVDSSLLHEEAVQPALTLLNTKEYQGPHQEFISAYAHYKNGKNKEALNDCLKAFESTMKAICDKRGWAYDPAKDTANKLIEIMFANRLVPPFWQQQFNSLRSLLESSIPTGRNKLGGHGQGAVPTEVPDYLTAYMLHMTASTLVFLTTAEKELP